MHIIWIQSKGSDNTATWQLLTVDSINHLFKFSNLKNSPMCTGGTEDLASWSCTFYRLIAIINCKYSLNSTGQPYLQALLNFANLRFLATYRFVHLYYVCIHFIIILVERNLLLSSKFNVTRQNDPFKDPKWKSFGKC